MIHGHAAYVAAAAKVQFLHLSCSPPRCPSENQHHHHPYIFIVFTSSNRLPFAIRFHYSYRAILNITD